MSAGLSRLRRLLMHNYYNNFQNRTREEELNRDLHPSRWEWEIISDRGNRKEKRAELFFKLLTRLIKNI